MKRESVECPIKCGTCCMCQWIYVGELCAQFPDEAFEADDGEGDPPCPYLSVVRGCTLDRDDRPEICNTYLCDEASDKLGVPRFRAETPHRLSNGARAAVELLDDSACGERDDS